MLPGACFGDDPRLAQASGEQRLAEDVVDLVGTGMGQVFSLEIETQLWRDGGGKAVGSIQRRRPAGVVREKLAQLGPEGRIVADLGVRLLDLDESRHQRLGHVAAA